MAGAVGPRAVVELGGLALVSVAGHVWLQVVQRRLFRSGLPTADPYTLPRPGVDLGAAAADGQSYRLAAAVVVLAYAVVLLRCGSATWRPLQRVAVGVGVAGHLVLLPAPPSLSIDVYSYVSHGYLAATPGFSPYVVPAGDVSALPVGADLIAAGWLPVHPQTPYGPLWTAVESAAWSVSGGSVSLAVLVLKAVVVLASLGCALAVGAIAHRLRAGTGPAAAVAYLWCPIVLSEFAADGHNDAVAVLFVLLALWLGLRGHAGPAVLALALGVLTKYTPAALALPLLVLLVQTRRSWRRLLLELGAGVGIAAVAGWLLWRPWWIGRSTLDGLTTSAVPFPSWSPAGVLAERLTDPASGEPDPRLRMVLAVLLLVVVAAASLVGWRHPRPQAQAAVWAAVAVAAFALLPNFWPWYALLPAALLSVGGTWVARGQLLVLTVGSRFAAPYGDLPVIGAVTFEDAFRAASVLGLTAPVAGVALLALGGRVTAGLRRRQDGRVGGRTPAG